jgi:hypothetical protein
MATDMPTTQVRLLEVVFSVQSMLKLYKENSGSQHIPKRQTPPLVREDVT